MKAIPEHSIAHYRVMEKIGAGGMGTVYKAYDKKLHRIVALKLLPPEYVSQQDRRRRFFQEARAASALNHPHILTVYEVGEDDGKPYIAMEYVEGETLRQKIRTRALPVMETLEIAIQIAEGLALSATSGIVHDSKQIVATGLATVNLYGRVSGLHHDRFPVTRLHDIS